MSGTCRQLLTICLLAFGTAAACAAPPIQAAKPQQHGKAAHAAPTPDALTQAASRGDLARVKRLIADGIPVNARDTNDATALHMAGLGQHNLLAEGVAGALDPASTKTALDVPGRKAVIKYLLSHRANPNARDDDGSTPLLFAVTDGSPVIVQSLLDGGADVNARDDDGFTALQMAVLTSRLLLVRLLIAHGADLSVRDRHGLTPLALAKQQGESRIAAELTRAGAAQ